MMGSTVVWKLLRKSNAHHLVGIGRILFEAIFVPLARAVLPWPKLSDLSHRTYCYSEPHVEGYQMVTTY